MNAKELKAKIETYFAACDATRERIEQKNGGVLYRQVPYTLAGLAAHIEMQKRDILKSAEGQGARATLLSDAIRRIERHLTERALLGELEKGMVLTLIRELGGNESETDAENRIEVVLDDREGWSE